MSLHRFSLLMRSVNCLPGGWRIASVHEECWSTYICCGRLCTALTGFVTAFAALIAFAAACGLAEAGAYPASGLLVTRWFPFSHRGRANSIVSFGGRVGNSLALWLTAGAIAFLGSWRPVLWIYGSIGVGLALATKIVFRDDPKSHPWTNEAELELISPVLPPSSLYSGAHPGWP